MQQQTNNMKGDQTIVNNNNNKYYNDHRTTQRKQLTMLRHQQQESLVVRMYQYNRMLQEQQSSSSSLNVGMIAGIGAGIAIIIVVLVVVVLHWFRTKSRRNSSNNSKNSNDTTTNGSSIIVGSSNNNNNGTSTSTNNNNNNGGGLTPKEKKTFQKLHDDSTTTGPSSSSNRENRHRLWLKQQQKADSKSEKNTNTGLLRGWDNNNNNANATTSTTTKKKEKGTDRRSIATKAKKDNVGVEERDPQNSKGKGSKYSSTNTSSIFTSSNNHDNMSWSDDNYSFVTNETRDPSSSNNNNNNNNTRSNPTSRGVPSATSSTSLSIKIRPSSRSTPTSDANSDADSLISTTDTNGNYYSSTNLTMMTYAYSLEAGNMDEMDASTTDYEVIATNISGSDIDQHRTDTPTNQQQHYGINIGNNNPHHNSDNYSLSGDDSFDTKQFLPTTGTQDNHHTNNYTIPDNMVQRMIHAPAGKLGIIIDTTVDGPIVYEVNPNSSVADQIFPGDIVMAINDIPTRHMNAITISQLVQKTNHLPRSITVLSVFSL